jgi:hypothetical protein
MKKKKTSSPATPTQAFLLVQKFEISPKGKDTKSQGSNRNLQFKKDKNYKNMIPPLI